MSAPPPSSVVEAFGARGESLALDGGEGLAFRAGGVVLKPVHDVGEAEWTQATLAEIEQDGFRVPVPVAAGDGGWVHEGWVANEFIPCLRAAAPRWHDIVDCGLRFGAAAERARPRNADALETRSHRWAVADRVAWNEVDVELPPEAGHLRAALADLTAHHPEPERHFVHGDLSGNVFIDDDDQLVVLDVSPYLRPRRWAAAIVVADAVLWGGADTTLATNFAIDEIALDLLARALIFRLVAEQLPGNPRRSGSLGPYTRVLACLS